MRLGSYPRSFCHYGKGLSRDPSASNGLGRDVFASQAPDPVASEARDPSTAPASVLSAMRLVQCALLRRTHRGAVHRWTALGPPNALGYAVPAGGWTSKWTTRVQTPVGVLG